MIWWQDNNKNLGEVAERKAERYLCRQGLTLIKRNYHSRFGEIDLIMQDSDALVFVEVRCRANNAQVTALESITQSKMAKIIKTAEHYLLGADEMPHCRFDVMAMTHYSVCSRYTMNKQRFHIEWIKNAF